MLGGLGVVVTGVSLRTYGTAPAESPAEAAALAHKGAMSSLAAKTLKQPLSFELNQGQAQKEVRFLARGTGFATFLTPDSKVVTLQGKKLRNADGSLTGRSQVAAVRFRLVGANPKAAAQGVDKLPGKANYLFGNDRSKWVTNVPTYERAKFANVYNGVDAYYYGRENNLEYDLVVAPGGDADQIRIACEGADAVHLDKRGDLVVQTAAGTIRQQKPDVYQVVNGERRKVDGAYEFTSVAGQKAVRVALGSYDHALPLVIDPLQRIYLTYLGGTGDDVGASVATDTSGNGYAYGTTNSAGFFLSGFESTVDHLYVTKFGPTGSRIWSTYMGGTAGQELAGEIVVDGSNQPVIVGSTGGSVSTVTALPGQSAYPTTVGAFQRHRQNGYDAFVTKLNSSGNGLVYSSIVSGTTGGGDDRGLAVALNSSGNTAYVVGRTNCGKFPAYPATFAPSILRGYRNTLSGGYDAFLVVLKMDSANTIGSAPLHSYTDASGTDDYDDLLYSTYIGGTNNEGTATSGETPDVALGVAVDSSGNAYVVGDTVKPAGVANFLDSTVGAYRRAYYGADLTVDGFLVKVNPAVSGSGSLAYGTLVGNSSSDVPTAVGVDASGQAIICGYTESGKSGTPAFPTTAGAVFTSYRGGLNDGFLTRFNSTGTGLVYSTYLGGSGVDHAYSVKVDTIGNAYVAGRTDSPPTGSTFFPEVQNTQIQSGLNANGDVYVMKFRPDGSGPIFSSYLGGTANDAGYSIAVDASGNAYVTGYTANGVLPTLNAYQSTYQGGTSDAFVGKFKLNDPPTFETAQPQNEATTCAAGGQTYTWSLNVMDVNSDTLQVQWCTKGPGAGSFTLDETDTVVGPAVVLGPPSVLTPTTGTVSFTHSFSAIGTTTVQAKLTDGLATVTYEWTVSIVDGDAPVIAGAVAGDMGTLYLTPTNHPGCDRYEGLVPIPTLTDCDPNPTITGSIPDPDGVVNNGDPAIADTTEFPGGFKTLTTASHSIYQNNTETFVVTWTATDWQGNISHATQTIVIQDVNPPTLTIPGDVTTPADDANGAYLTPQELKILGPAPSGTTKGYGASDDCGEATIIAFRDNPWTVGDGDDATDDSGVPEELDGQYPLGRSLITWIAFDEDFNFTEHYQEVYVEGSTSVTSPFDADGESWTTTGTDVTAASYTASGGSPGTGYISASQPSATSALWYFEAPSKYRGNMQGAHSQSLTFNLQLSGTADVSSTQGVILSGGGLILYAPLGSTPTTSWGTQSVAFATSAGWKVDNGDGNLGNDVAATDAQIVQALGSVASLKIRGKFVSTAGASTKLDSVNLPLVYVDPTPTP